MDHRILRVGPGASGQRCGFFAGGGSAIGWVVLLDRMIIPSGKQDGSGVVAALAVASVSA
jgi:hypothetical protein